MNIVALIGRFCFDPELKQTPSGVSVCTFRLAVDRVFSKDHEADFIDCVAWRQTAEFISKYFAKGAQIGVTGHLRALEYAAKDGSKRKVVEVVVDNASFCGSKKDAGASSYPDDFEVVDDNEDLPF